MLKPGRRSRWAVLLMIFLSSAATHPARAGNDAAGNIAFTLRCFGLAFSDPEEHVAVCNPVRFAVPASEDGDGDDVERPLPPAPPPPPPPEEEDDDDGCGEGMFAGDCGGCYYPA